MLGYQALALAQTIAAAGGFLTWIGQVTGVTHAAVQAVLNLVMSANPIALVVIAIAALVAGFIVAYNTSEDFRNVVNGVFNAVADAGRWLWNNALAPAFRFIVSGFAGVMRALADFVGGLGNIPGFEWAKDAAGKLRGLADQADAAARGIRTSPTARTSSSISRSMAQPSWTPWAGTSEPSRFRGAGLGGPVSRTGAYPWARKVLRSSSLRPARRSSPQAGRGPSCRDPETAQPAIAATADSGFTRLHPDDLRALAGCSTPPPQPGLIRGPRYLRREARMIVSLGSERVPSVRVVLSGPN